MPKAPLTLLKPNESSTFLGSSEDSRWAQRRSVVEVVSAAADTDKLAIGSSPWLGDYAGTGIEVPLAATAGPTNRYLFRLCGLYVPSGGAVRIIGLRTLATLRAGFQAAQGGNTYFVEKEIVSPLWSFLDGNISWHLRWLPARSHRNAWGAGGPAGTSANLNGVDSALLYNNLAPYVAPAQGLPPGRDVEYLGTWRDMRFPWHETNWNLDIPLIGAGKVVLFASVFQTNPETRFRLPAIADPGALRPEDRFLQAYPLNCVYGHVGGAITFEMNPRG